VDQWGTDVEVIRRPSNFLWRARRWPVGSLSFVCNACQLFLTVSLPRFFSLAYGLDRLINTAALLPITHNLKCNKKAPVRIHAALRAFKL
jgi:hypothetical protein